MPWYARRGSAGQLDVKCNALTCRSTQAKLHCECDTWLPRLEARHSISLSYRKIIMYRENDVELTVTVRSPGRCAPSRHRGVSMGCRGSEHPLASSQQSAGPAASRIEPVLRHGAGPVLAVRCAAVRSAMDDAIRRQQTSTGPAPLAFRLLQSRVTLHEPPCWQCRRLQAAAAYAVQGSGPRTCLVPTSLI